MFIEETKCKNFKSLIKVENLRIVLKIPPNAYRG